jgi:nucleotide-binding universal stress UspA family protein
MKKILLAFDGIHFSEGAFEFARQLNDLQPILLVGAFVPQLSYANLWSYADGMAGAMYIPTLEEEDSQAVKKNIERFEELCRKNFINYKVHKDFYDFALPELRKETRYADLLIISSETFYQNITNGNATEYLEEALRHSECPVIIVPENFQFPNANILAYDGSEESVYAIKQFAYLFPELHNQETLLIFSSAKKDSTLPDEEQIEELVKQHFFDVSLEKLDLNPKRFFSAWIAERPASILVCGSFGRSMISEMFHKSFASNVIAEHKIPVFIAHK